mgnify:CR=1 FL=1
MKKLFTILLVLTLVLSSFSMTFATPDLNYMENKKSIAFDERTKNLKDSDEIRIIVELNEEPLISHATDNNKKVSELDANTIQSMTKALENEQNTLTKALNSKGSNIEIHKTFTNIFNGFSCTTTFEQAKKLEKLPGVKKVYVANKYYRPEPEMHESLGTIEARIVWENLGYTGEGKVISIIDTGIDPSHQDMILSNPENKKLDQDFIENLGLAGLWHTDKVPYGYNYFDNDQEILDLGPNASRHGMHVAGTAAANGDEENGGIKGVAPEAQLLAMKVFSNGEIQYTYSDIYIEAIDDSILMGADVINMSLGSTAGFVKPDDPEQQAVKRAVDNGLVVAISGGNSDKFGSGFDNPLAKNPDIGVVGSPGTTFESIQVASSDNVVYWYQHNIQVPGIDNALVGYGIDDWAARLSSSNLELTAIGGTKLGALEDYEGIDVTGKVVLVKRGGHSFRDKTAWASQKGAVGIIVYDHGLSTFYKNQGGWEIPFTMITKEDGEALEAILADGAKNINVTLKEKNISPTTGFISDFSSWGLAPNLVFKPEITAPGGSIVSTDQNNGYQMMSGTSMSSPHVAGGSALVLQFVEEKFPELQGAEKVTMVKNLIMSTANPILESVTNDVSEYSSPRSQGAGVMDLYKATTTNAIVVDKLTGMSKVALNEVDDSIEFTVRVKNFTYQPLFYKVSGTVATDLVNQGYILGHPQPIVNDNNKTPINFDFEYNFFDMFRKINDLTIDNNVKYKMDALNEFMEKSNIENIEDQFSSELTDKYDSKEKNKLETNKLASFDDSIDFDFLNNLIFVPMKSSVDVKVSIDLDDAKALISDSTLDELFENGGFVEGFIQFKDILSDNDKLDLSIPYCGFYGDWDQAPILDGTVYDEESYYGAAGLLGTYGEDLYYLGQNPDQTFDSTKIGFSPNGDGSYDNILPLFSLLRNAKKIDIDILDANNAKILDFIDQECIPKSYCDGKPANMYHFDPEWMWNGTVDGEVVPDGQYYLQVKTVIDYPDAEWNTNTFPIYVDTVAPVINNLDYNQETNILTTNATDEGISIYEYILFENGAILQRNTTGQFNINELTSGEHNVRVLVLDYANNLGVSNEITVVAE